MDLLNLIKEKAQYFSTSKDNRGIASVIIHIEIAERHYENGKSGNDYLFNDVIYRSNQAFEGALKEAYKVITGKQSNKIKPYAIEKYFEENNVLKNRVLQLFTNYRIEWRNKSTHDYKLYFSEQEAFLAIINISAFINILLDQMIEKKAYINESNNLNNTPKPYLKNTEKDNLLNRTIEMLRLFSTEIPDKIKAMAVPRISQIEVIGAFTAFINTMANDIEIYSEYSPTNVEVSRKYLVDLFLKKNDEKIIIEVKNVIHNFKTALETGTNQLLNYLAAHKVRQGILYIPPTKENINLKKEIIKFEMENTEYSIIQLYPIPK